MNNREKLDSPLPSSHTTSPEVQKSTTSTHGGGEAIQLKVDLVILSIFQLVHDTITLSNEGFDGFRVAYETFPAVRTVDLLQFVSTQIAFYASPEF